MHKISERLKALAQPMSFALEAEPPPCLHGAGAACSSNCLQCKWAWNEKVWKSKFPWLEAVTNAVNGKVLHLTCRVCNEDDARPIMLLKCHSAQSSTFRRHALTRRHKANTPGGRALCAPTPNDFQILLERFHQHRTTGEDGVEGIGKRHKIRKMLFCLAEAVRTRTRLKLSGARSVTLHSDASKGRLLVRAQMCGDDLEPYHCFLGTTTLGDDATAHGIATSIVRILRDLASPFMGAPGSEELEAKPNLPALTRMCNVVEVFNADAANDEQLAGRLLEDTGGLAPGDVGGFPVVPAFDAAVDGDAGGGAPFATVFSVFPNMKVINKDKPHGARRIDATPTSSTPTEIEHFYIDECVFPACPKFQESTCVSAVHDVVA